MNDIFEKMKPYLSKWEPLFLKWFYFYRVHTWLFHILLALVPGAVFSVGCGILNIVKRIMVFQLKFETYDLTDFLFSLFVMTFVFGFFFFYPIILSAYSLRVFIWAIRGKLRRRTFILYDIWTMALAWFMEYLFLDFFVYAKFDADYFEQLVNLERHTPIYTRSVPTILTLAAIFFLALCIFLIYPSEKRPPLVTVLGISGLYIGMILSIVFTIQVLQPAGFPECLPLLLPPANTLLIGIRIIITEIKGYTPDADRMSRIESSPILLKINALLCQAKYWPILALLLMLPMLGVLIAVLVLFGQAPDAAIKAFTETADYTFSTKIPPQNLTYDAHYLCTVAAGGHKEVVRPLRRGRRHGHEIVVNRQLCIANAFEQILEEKNPRMHKAIRGFYDQYGFPVAKLIRSKYAADMVWFLMKPLEWIFLIVIYMTDAHPEDRIHSQYL